MKRIILSLVVVAFAVAVQAGDAKTQQTKDKEKPACCASKMKTAENKDEAGCPFAAMGCGAKKQQAKKSTTKQQVLLSPKAADTAR